MKIRIFEKGFNYSQDGPGNRLVYHLSGCNMFCPWCSNPEGMAGGGKEYTAEEIANEIISCVPMFFDGGGVTFTGGECTLQADAVCEIIDFVKEKNISCAIESNAMTDGFLKTAEKCDTVILDFKSPKQDVLKSVTGGDLQKIKNNIKSIIGKKHIHIRIPLIHNFNDDEESLKLFCEFFNKLKNFGSFDVELLPYHEYGKEKWRRCGKEYTVSDGHVRSETLRHFIKTFKENSIKIINT